MNKKTVGGKARDYIFSFIERQLFFIMDHPEFRNHTPSLRSAYATCRAEQLDGSSINLEEAYEHIFVKDGGCKKCQAHFQSLKEPLDELLRDLKR